MMPVACLASLQSSTHPDHVTGADGSAIDSKQGRRNEKQYVDQGWKASLNLSFENTADKTVLRRYHHGPLLVQRPFYPEGRACHVVILHPPGGVVGGDRLNLQLHCANDASGLVTTPGANRFYGSDGRQAEQQQLLSVDNGTLEWLPMETLYFDECAVSQSLRITLTDQSRFIGWDIACFGRPAGGYLFNHGKVTTRLEVYRQGQPLLHERLSVNSANDLNRVSGLRGALVYGTMLLCSAETCSPELLTLVRAQLPQSNDFSATQLDSLIIVRYLGNSAEVARQGFTRVWQALRPAVIQKKAMVPRIWST